MKDMFKTIKVLLWLLLFTVLTAYLVGYIFQAPSGNVAHIRIRGEILSEEGFFMSGVSSQKIVDRINRASADPKIEAILIEINSPGGTVVASREVANALKEVDKTTVCWMRDIATSGAYWVASSCDKIIADDFTITGSIGVSGSYLEFSGLFEKYGVGYVRLISGDGKDIGTPFREPTTQELETLQNMIDRIQEVFVRDVAENRQLSIDYVNEISDSSIILGMDALEFGLIDYLGGKKEAIELVRTEANLTEVSLLEYRDELSFFDLVSMSVSQRFFEHMISRKVDIKAI